MAHQIAETPQCRIFDGGKQPRLFVGLHSKFLFYGSGLFDALGSVLGKPAAILAVAEKLAQMFQFGALGSVAD